MAPSITARYFSSCPSDPTSRWAPCPPEPSALRPARRYPRLRIRHSSSEHRRDFNPPEQHAAQRTLRPRLTSRSASQRCPFRHKARSPQVRLRDLHRTAAGSTQWLLGRYGFAVSRPLALTHHALYPVPVRRLAVLLRASSRPHLAVTLLRFASARCGLLTQRTFTSKSRAMRGARDAGRESRFSRLSPE